MLGRAGKEDRGGGGLQHQGRIDSMRVQVLPGHEALEGNWLLTPQNNIIED